MKKLALVTLSTILLLSCCNKNQNAYSTLLESNQDSIVYFEEEVFPESKEDTTYSIQDYVYSTDWMKTYVAYLKKNYRKLDGSDEMWEKKNGEKSFDCKYWSLAYVNSDTIPEMLLYGGCIASGSIILTQYDGKVYESPKGGFMFIEGADGVIHSQGAHSGEFWGGVYEMREGQFVEKCHYYCFTGYYDTNEIERFGLNRENLNNWLMDDGTVGVSGVEWNGKLIDANYGINNWTTYDMKQWMDSLYYSKGVSVWFPKPSRDAILSIGDLLLNK